MPSRPCSPLILALILTLAAAPALAQVPRQPLLLAQAQLSAEDIFWQSIQASTEPAMFQAYLDQVSAGRFGGTYKALAEIKLATVAKPPGASPNAPANAAGSPPASAPGRAVIIQGAEPPQTPAAASKDVATGGPDVEACDRAAAAPTDSEKPAAFPGVTYASIDASAAILACRKAVQIPGAPRRVFFQLARAIHKSGSTVDALSYYGKAVELGHVVAMHNFAGVLRSGEQGVKRDPGLAMALYERAAAAGFNDSLVQLGAMYVSGRGTRRDYAKARDYYQRAIDAKTPGAYTNMGVLYDNGLGVPRNRIKACEYWREGAGLGDEVAAKNLKRSCRIR